MTIQKQIWNMGIESKIEHIFKKEKEKLSKSNKHILLRN